MSGERLGKEERIVFVGDDGAESVCVEEELGRLRLEYVKVLRRVDPMIGPELRVGTKIGWGVANILLALRHMSGSSS